MQWIGNLTIEKLVKSFQNIGLLMIVLVTRKEIEDWVLHIEKPKARSDTIFERGLSTLNSGYQYCFPKGMNLTAYLPIIRLFCW